MRTWKIAPSLACGNPLDMRMDIEVLDSYHVDFFHADIMDGHFVPNYCLSFEHVKAIKEISKTPIDVHLMTTHVERDVDRSIQAGASQISFHVEIPGNHMKLLERIRDKGAKAALSINPETPVQVLEAYFDVLDCINVMAVKPGFAGQAFLEQTYRKVYKLAKMKETKNASFLICVDGGIDFGNGVSCLKAGADMLVAGKLCVYRGNLNKDLPAFLEEMERNGFN